MLSRATSRAGIATPLFLLAAVASGLAQAPSFRGRHDYEVQGTFSGLSAYDCNADGIPDLVDWGSDSSDQEVLFGNGDGTFQPFVVTSRSLLYQPFAQRVADFNNDGKPDIVQFGFSPNNDEGVQVLLGGPNCSFPTGGQLKILVTDPQKFDLFQQIAVGDFNGDGNMDVVGLFSSVVNNVNYFKWVFLPGDGKGNFGTPVTSQAGNQLPSGLGIGVGDFNQDGYLDMAVPSTTGITIWYGLGNGTFREAASQINLQGLNVNVPIAVTDVNKDGYLDLITSTFTGGNGSGETAIFLGGAGGTFSPAAFISGMGGFVVAGDMNGDHILDIIGGTGNGVNLQGVGVALGRGDGTFEAPLQLAAVGGSLTVADLRNNGVLDIVQQGDNAISVLLNSGNNKYPDAPGIAVPSGADPSCVALADFNRDGIMDAAFIDTIGTVSVLFGTGRPAIPFRLGPTTPNTGGFCLRAGDYNNDGIPDVVISSGNPFGGFYQVLTGNGDGTFTPQPVLDTLGFSTMCTGDFNGDGNLDVVNGYGIVAFGKGNGSFEPPVNLSVFPSEGTTYCATGDLNGDGITDVVLSSTGHDSLYVYLGNKAGTFAPVATYPSFLNFPITVADVNGDGIPDVVGVNDQGIQVFLGAGGGVLVPQTVIQDAAQSDTAIQVVVADFNGDGKVDLAIADQDSFYGGYISLMTGNGDGTFVDAGLAGGWLPVDAILPIYLQGQKLGAPYDLIEAGGSHFAWLYTNSK